MLWRFLRYGKFIFGTDRRYKNLTNLDFKYNIKNNLYYIHDYNSKSTDEEFYKEDLGTQYLLKLKNGDLDATKYYSELIAKFISNSVPENRDYVVVCVPSSDKDSKSCMNFCIETIKNNPDMITNKSIRMVPGEHELLRTKSIPKAHRVPVKDRPSFKENIDSLCYRSKANNKVDNTEVVAILIDDIATTCTSIKACEKLLVTSGFKEKNIFRLVMGYTVYKMKEK